MALTLSHLFESPADWQWGIAAQATKNTLRAMQRLTNANAKHP